MISDLTVDDLQKWDYLVVSCEDQHLAQTLNARGALGWKLVTAAPRNTYHWTFIFQRMRL